MFAKHLFSQFIVHGLAALFISVIVLIALQGGAFSALMLFGLPTVFAATSTSAASKSARALAWGFLVALGIGALLAHVPAVFPLLGGFNRNLAPWQDRLLSWHVGVYALCIPLTGIVVFRLSLKAHREGRIAEFSRPTCHLGLLASLSLAIGFPLALGSLGFWPVW